MERIYQHHVASRRTDWLERVKSDLLSCSNAIHTYCDGTKWKPNYAQGLLDETKKFISCDLMNLNNQNL